MNNLKYTWGLGLTSQKCTFIVTYGCCASASYQVERYYQSICVLWMLVDAYLWRIIWTSWLYHAG